MKPSWSKIGSASCLVNLLGARSPLAEFRAKLLEARWHGNPCQTGTRFGTEFRAKSHWHGAPCQPVRFLQHIGTGFPCKRVPTKTYGKPFRAKLASPWKLNAEHFWRCWARRSHAKRSNSSNSSFPARAKRLFSMPNRGNVRPGAAREQKAHH